MNEEGYMTVSEEVIVTQEEIMDGGLLNAHRLYRRDLLNLRGRICTRQNNLGTSGPTRRNLERVVAKVDSALMEVEANIGNLED